MVLKRKEKVNKKDDTGIEIPKSVIAPRPRKLKKGNIINRKLESNAQKFHSLKHEVLAPMIAHLLLQKRFNKLTSGLDTEETLLLSDQEDSIFEVEQGYNGSDKENLGKGKGKGKRKAKSTADDSSNDGDTEHREEWRDVASFSADSDSD